MKKIALTAGILSGLLFGIATPLSKALLGELNSFQLAGLLYLGAAVAMLPFIFNRNSQLLPMFKRKNLLKTVGIIFFGGFLGPLLLMLGLKSANAASVSIWLNMELVATALLGVLFFKDSLDKFAWMGVAFTLLAGIVTTFGEGVSSIASGLLITAACFSWAIDNHLTALTDGSSPHSVTFIKGIVAGSVNFGIGCLLSSTSLPLGSLAPAIGIGIFSYGFSIVLYVTSAQNIGATRGQVLFSTAPLWGVMLSYLFLNEPFQWVHVVSIVLLALAVVVTNILSHSHRHSHIAIFHVHYHTHNDGHHQHIDPVGLDNKKGGHAHEHAHEPFTHEHPHHPDLHHRHEH